MKHEISSDRKTLTLIVDDAERDELRELGELIHADANMVDFLEPIVCNSELEWIDPSRTGDLTSAPMLGITAQPETAGHLHSHCHDAPAWHGVTLVGHWNGEDQVCRITERWAFMNYQVRSVLEDLRDTGKAVFVS